jgi:hypothetical protein
VPVTVPVILELLLAHGDPLNANVPLTELPFWISFPVPITFANVGEVGALNFTIIQVPLKLGSNGFPPPQPVTKKSAIIPVRLTKVALTIEFLAIDLITILLTFRKRRLANVCGLALGMLESFRLTGTLHPMVGTALLGGETLWGKSYSFD